MLVTHMYLIVHINTEYFILRYWYIIFDISINHLTDHFSLLNFFLAYLGFNSKMNILEWRVSICSSEPIHDQKMGGTAEAEQIHFTY